MSAPPGADALADAETAVDLVYSDRPRARRLAERAKSRSKSSEVAVVADHALGLVALSSGDLAMAAERFRQSIAVAQQLGLTRRAAQVQGTLAYTLALTGETAEALRLVDAAIPVLDGLLEVRLRMQRALVLTELSRFADAAAEFARALDLLHGSGSDGDGGAALLEGDIHINRSILRYRTHDWQGAEDDLTRAEECYRRSGQAGRWATIAHNRGAAAVTRGDLPAAFTFYDEAEQRYRAQGRDAGLLPVDRASALLSVRLVAEARVAATAAVEDYSRQRNAIDLVQARLVLAEAALADGDPATGRAEARRAALAASRQQRDGWAALAGYLALRARWEAGERTPAMLRYGRATIARLDESGWVIAALDARLIVGRLLLERGQVALASEVFADAARARDQGPADLRARAWLAEALLRDADGDRATAEAALLTGLSVLDRFRDSLGARELRAHVASAGTEVANLGLSWALERGEAADVFEWAERWRAGALLAPPVRPPDDARLADDLAALRQVASETSAAAAAGEDAHEGLARQAALEEAICRRARHATASGTAPDRTVHDVAAVANALGHRVLVEYIVHGDTLHAVVLTDQACSLVELGSVAAVDDVVSALRFGLRRLAYDIGSPSSLDAAERLVDRRSRQVDGLLLSPLCQRFDLGDHPLVIVPTGPLHAVPWAALPSCAGRAVSLAPSAGLWLRAASQAHRPRRRGRVVLASGPDLPHGQAEVAALGRRYTDPTRLSGPKATVAAVTAALDGADLAHIAAHGHFRADNPLFSSLRLADGPLTVYDIERLTQAPRQVVLSACDSGLPTVHAGDELLGLAAVLLSMGTTALIATLIPVPDDASRPLMLRLHHHLLEGQSPAVALARAQAEAMRRSARRLRVAAAGFVCFGAS